MESIKAFLEYYGGVRKRTNRLLKSIPPAHFDFAYKEGKFTIADQIRHIAAIERLMFAETVSGRKSMYRGCSKELADGYENVLNYFHRAHDETLEIIGNLADVDLQKNCLTPIGVEINIKKWLQFLAEHEIHHRAQLYLCLNMLDIKTPPMYGLTAEQLTEYGM